jgi:CAAX prenyl protease-like protein
VDRDRLSTPLSDIASLPRRLDLRARLGIVAAVLLVEIRGYLMRRLISPRFESVALADVRWPALALSALAFGAMHGALWLPGIVSGWAYGALAIKTGKLGEAVAAHATTNALLAIYVLRFDQWQLW